MLSWDCKACPTSLTPKWQGVYMISKICREVCFWGWHTKGGCLDWNLDYNYIFEVKVAMDYHCYINLGAISFKINSTSISLKWLELCLDWLKPRVLSYGGDY